ncbi:MAG: diguanylate cyclase, partial [Gammaproteobacteria bacterium]|nr:diguanylate cyclase [Gammaproteobacteria bacterium]
MNLKKKTTLLMCLAMGFMVLVLLFSSIVLFRHLAITSIKPNALGIANLIRDNMTNAMADGTVHNWDAILQKLKDRAGLLDVRVVRTDAVIGQFGPDKQRRYEITDDERSTIELKKPAYGLHGFNQDARFIASIPYIASSTEQPNCLSCHQVTDGTVLGVITLEMSIVEQWRTALLSVLVIVAVLMLVAILTIFSFRRALTSFEVTAKEIESVVNRAHSGDFTGRISQNSDDEIGRIAKMLNQLLALVDCEIEGLSKKVVNLLHYDAALGKNLLLSMTELVESLVEVSHFKQAIEEDETSTEIYLRLAKIIHGYFDITQFSLYEVNADKGNMLPVIIDGKISEECIWCDPEISVRATACRAKRTGKIVDAISFPEVCPYFSGEEDMTHVCIPVNQSGSVGNVLQLVMERKHAALTQMYVPFIVQYLHEAAPVIESKRLMDALRESSLTDPMTGLHNRRYLEEFTKNLVAYTERTKSTFSILMTDLDYFKQVNDTYGHDAGDIVLKELSKVLHSSVRETDLVI